MKIFKTCQYCILTLLLATSNGAGAADRDTPLQPLDEWPQLLPALQQAPVTGLSRASVLQELQLEEKEEPIQNRRARGKRGKVAAPSSNRRAGLKYPSTPKRTISAAQIDPSAIKLREKLFLSFSAQNRWFDSDDPSNRVSLVGANVASGKFSFVPGHETSLQTTIENPYLLLHFTAPFSGNYAISCQVQSLHSGRFVLNGRNQNGYYTIGQLPFDQVQNASSQQLYLQKGAHVFMIQLVSGDPIWLNEIAVTEL